MTRNPIALAVGGLAAILAIALLVITVLGEGQRSPAPAHEEAGPKPAQPSDVTSGGFRLNVSLSPDSGVVGEVVTVNGRLTDAGGAAVRNVRYELVSHHIEDDVDVFKTTFVSPDGTFSWGNQFWDGVEHEIKITASPAPDASAQFSPLTLRRIVEVEPVPPQVAIQLRALFWLLVPVALGLAVGIPLGLRVPARRAGTVQASTAPA